MQPESNVLSFASSKRFRYVLEAQSDSVPLLLMMDENTTLTERAKFLSQRDQTFVCVSSDDNAGSLGVVRVRFPSDLVGKPDQALWEALPSRRRGIICQNFDIANETSLPSFVVGQIERETPIDIEIAKVVAIRGRAEKYGWKAKVSDALRPDERWLIMALIDNHEVEALQEFNEFLAIRLFKVGALVRIGGDLVRTKRAAAAQAMCRTIRSKYLLEGGERAYHHDPIVCKRRQGGGITR
ncbi:hypothetical protein X731_03895 [Mesorhizobium sp. L2C054A000]|nr:hypothetical protein X731_03895 [Mesorhizobium sp. L2C054A000]